jgi:DNA polymerase III delta prime subunit
MWEDKHKPDAWQNFVGNAGAVQQCKDWIKNFQTKVPDTPRVLIISGPEGCGKSLAADLLLRKQGYKAYAFGVKEIKNHKGDKNCLDNFCNLYMSNLSGPLGAGKTRRQTHGIVLEDFDGLTRSDKTFNSAILDLIKKNPSPVTPLIITTSESNLSKQSGGLLRLAHVVFFQRLLIKDLVRIAQRIATDEQLYLDDDQADLFAQNAHGDIRQLIMAMEMFYVSHKTGTKIELSQVTDFLDEHGVDSDAKICMATEGGLSASQTEDERILGMAIGDRGDKRSVAEKQSAIRLIIDNSLQFSPFLFQAYLKCLPCRVDRQPTIIKALEVAAEIANDMSEADIVKESSWNMDAHLELFGTLGLEVPIRKLRNTRNDEEDSRNFKVSIAGYQTFYGVENTINNQQKLALRLRELNPACPPDPTSLAMMKELYADWLENKTDMEIAQLLFPIHPDYLEVFSRIKTGSQLEYSITKARLKRLIKCHDELLELNKPTVKFLDAQPPLKQRKKVETKNNMFALNFE